MNAKEAQRLLEPWEPAGDDIWDRRKVAHLLRRAAFGGTPSQWRACLDWGFHGTLRWLFESRPDDPAFAALLGQVGGELLDLSTFDDLRAWWLYRMLHAPHPLGEKMTLFWHGHFATSGAKVNDPDLMRRQNDTLRRHALGNFRLLLRDISRDPAMLIWLDNRANVKAKPNENYARELLELFSMGIGNYTEADIKNAARAFTGWHLKANAFFFNRAQHDDGDKNFLGARGRLGGDEIIDTLLAHHAPARFLARKLLSFFVCDAPEPALVDAMAERLRRSDYDIGALLRVVFSSKLFYSPLAYKALIKSPVEMALGAVQALEGRISTRLLGGELAAMGQNLLFPPNVKGWDGARDWVNPSRLLARWNFAMKLTAARGGKHGSHIDPATPAERYGHKTAEDVVDYYLWNLVQFDISVDLRRRLLDYLERWDNGRRKFAVDARTLDTKVRGLIHVILTLPEYQVS
jgi:uncharacterized protein (DUF1800 family)